MAERSLKQLSDYLPADDVATFKEELNGHREYLDHDPGVLEMNDILATIKRLEELAQQIAERAYSAMT